MALHLANYVRCTLGWDGAAVPTGAATVFTVQDDNLLTFAEIADLIEEHFEDVADALSTQVAVTSLAMKRGPDDVGPSTETAMVLPGGNGSNSLPPNVSLLVTKSTGLGGHRGRGRMYLPGFREDKINNDGTVDTEQLGFLNTHLGAFWFNMDADSCPLVLEHSDQPSALAPTPITALSCQAKVATQRRRLRR